MILCDDNLPSATGADLVFDDSVEKGNDLATIRRKAGRKPSSEKEIEDELEDFLVRKGRPVVRQVGCDTGIIDIISDNDIFEVKYTLKRRRIFEAVGQLMLYRHAHSPRCALYLVGQDHDDCYNLYGFLRSIGITVWQWD